MPKKGLLIYINIKQGRQITLFPRKENAAKPHGGSRGRLCLKPPWHLHTFTYMRHVASKDKLPDPDNFTTREDSFTNRGVSLTPKLHVY